MDDERARLVKPAVRRALDHLASRVMVGKAWPVWFVDVLEELALEAFAVGVQHAHERKTARPAGLWDADAITPVRDVFKR